MKKISVLVMVALTVLALAAQVSAAEVKVGVLDLNAVLTESDAGKAANAELLALAQARQATVDEKGAAVEKFSKEVEALKAEEQEAKQAELDKLIQDYQQTAAQAETEIQNRVQELRNQVLAEINEVVKAIGQRDNYTFITDVTSVYYFSAVVDITSEVIRTYNELRAQ